MKEIKAIIRPFKLDDVVTALHKIEELPGLTISEIKGFGRTKAKGAPDSFLDGLHNYIKRIKIEIVVNDNLVTEVVDVIQQTAYTGNSGDGKIFVIEVANTIRIRTNEHGEKAI
ncbi:MAG: P-II family nitrogen regulator [Melioribacteraceae bacterium]|nr:P-II family nitrogen regulator [Melioribacteraceae bacterium]